MCGIAGMVRIDASLRDEEATAAVTKMVASLQHRGPDATGVTTHGVCTLGSCRLAILGLEQTSDQPLRSPDSQCVLVFNGEIFNYVELRSELVARGHHFASSGDTEVLVHGFEEWHQDLLRRLNGMFALAILDMKSDELFVARDRFGVKPLYYAGLRAGWLFASEPRAILDSGYAKPEMDTHAALDYLKFGITDVGDRTFFKSIRQVPPGYYGFVQQGRLRLTKWYDVAQAARERIEQGGDASFATQLAGILSDSVRLRLRSDVPVGLLLSGGLDSSAIAATSAQLPHPRDYESFTVTFPGSAVDESKYAVAVADRVGLSSNPIPAAGITPKMVHDCVERQGEPFISPSVLAQWMVMEAVHTRSLKVLLSGQGADEYLGGYEYFDSYALLSFLREGNLSAVLRHVSRMRDAGRLLRSVRGLFFVRLPGYLKLAAWKKPWLRELDHSPVHCEYASRLITARSFDEARILHLLYRLPELLRFEDRNSMAFSIETRHPFLDHRLVEWALAAREDSFVRDGVRKWVLHEAMKGSLPDSVLDRRDKIGFETPDDWLRSATLRAEIWGLLDQAPDEISRLVDIAKVGKLLNQRLSHRRLLDLWRVYNLLLWYRLFIAGTAVSRPDEESSPQ